MDYTATRTRRQDGDPPQSHSPPNVMSNSTNISQSGFHRVTTGPTLQGRPSYATMARKVLSDERLDSAAGASPAVASRRREPRPTDNQTTAHPMAASRGHTEQFNAELDARSRAGKPPLDADNTQNVSAYTTSSSKSYGISETRAAQGEGATNSGTIVSASSTQQPAHLMTNSPPSWNVLPSRALRENSSNVSLSVAAPGPETRKRNESPHLQEDSRSQSTAIRPRAEQVDRAASVQPSVKPSTSYHPSSSSSERRAYTPHAEQIDRTASIQPSAKPFVPPSPPFLSSEGYETRPHTDSVTRTASSPVQPSFNPSTPDHPPSSSSERNATRPSAEPVNRTASVRPPAKPSTPPPPLDRSSTSMSPSSSSPAPPLAKMASNRMRGVLSYEYQAQSRESLSESPHPAVADRGLGNARSGEQGRKHPSGASRRPPAPAEHTPATTKLRQDHKDPSDAPRRPPVPPEHIPTTTDLHSLQNRKVPSATSDRLPVLPEHAPATTVSPPLQDPKGIYAVPPRPLVLPKHTPATTAPPSNSLSQPVSGLGDLNRNKSGIQGKEGVDRGAERAMEGSFSVREERNRVVALGEREYRLKDSANAKSNLTSSHVQDVLQYPRSHSESFLHRTYSSYRSHGYGHSAPYLPDTNYSPRAGLSSGHSDHPQSSMASLSLRHAPYVHLGAPDLQEEYSSGSSSSEERGEPVSAQPVPMERHTMDGPRMRVAGDEPQREQRHQAKSNPGGNLVGVLSISPPDSDAVKSRFGNVVDARPMLSQPLSTSISPGEGKAQQRTRSGDMTDGSGDRVRLQTYRNPEQERDGDEKPLFFRWPSSRGNPGDRPSRTVERDEPTQPVAARSRSRSLSTEPGQSNQPMHTITLPGNTKKPEVTAVSQPQPRTYSWSKAPPPPPQMRAHDESWDKSCCCCIC